MLFASLIMGASYATEWFAGWYGGNHDERAMIAWFLTGSYAPLYWAMIACNVVIPQLFWLPSIRRNILAVVLIAIAVNIGMWLERILIVWNTLSHATLPSMRHIFIPTFWDWSLLLGSLGLFAFLFLLFVRLVPVVSRHEVQRLVQEGA
jgi:molybdopterin-containing oxidoreductase family membrane subunit